VADSDCIFCKIVAGDIPCHRLYEDEHVLSFLDVGPLSRGHALVIPKKHHVTLDQVPPHVGSAIGAVLPRLSKAVCDTLGASAWNVLQNNGKAAHQAVGHVHFHIIPKPTDEPEKGLGITWPAGDVDHDEAGKLAKQIRAALA